MADEEEILEEEGVEMEAEAVEEDVPAASEFVPDAPTRAKSDVYTLILILTFVSFLTGIIIAGRELYENYDVQFWVFEKTDGQEQADGGPAPE